MACSVPSQSQIERQVLPAAAAASMMARVERLDLVVGYMEEMRNVVNAGAGSTKSNSPRSSTLSPSSSSAASSAAAPRSAGAGCRSRPAKELLQEARAKGSLVDRIAFLESRVLRMEELGVTDSAAAMEIVTTTSSGSERTSRSPSSGSSDKKKNKGLKSLVKSCVRRNLKTKD